MITAERKVAFTPNAVIVVNVIESSRETTVAVEKQLQRARFSDRDAQSIKPSLLSQVGRSGVWMSRLRGWFNGEFVQDL